MSEIAIGHNPLFEVESTYLSKLGIVYQTSAFDGLEGFPVDLIVHPTQISGCLLIKGNADRYGNRWKKLVKAKIIFINTIK